MLKKLRNASNSIFIKIIFGAIIVSFCLWGVGDIVRNYSASRPVITVKSSKISVESFIREYNQEKQRIRNSINSSISDNDIKKFNIAGTIIENMTQRLVFREALKKLGITVSNKTVLEFIQSVPEFQKDGYFDVEIYESLLRKAGISEATFANQTRESVERIQLFHPIVIGYKIPKFIRRQIAEEFESQHTLFISKIKISDMKFDETPTKKDLKEYFNANKEKYKLPEIRNIAILIIDYKKFLSDFKVNENDVDRVYKESKNSYRKAETRDFERFAFDRKEDADKAWVLINKDISAKKIEKKFALKVEIVQDIYASDFPKDIGKHFFELKLNESSSVLHIGEKYYIYRVVRINSPKQLSESEIKTKIREEMQSEQVNSPEFFKKIKEVKNNIDDWLGAGKSINDIVKKEKGLELIELKGSLKNMDEKLTKITKDQDAIKELKEAIFSTEEQQASQNIDSKENRSFVVYINKIEKSHTQPFEKIYDKVEKDFIFSNQSKEAEDKVYAIMNNGATAVDEVIKMKEVKQVKISKKDLIMNHNKLEGILKEIPFDTIMRALSIKNGEVTQFKNANEYVIIGKKATEKAENLTEKFINVISNYIDQESEKDIMSIMPIVFKKWFSANINKKLIDATLNSFEQD
ncbi:MAG: SurA N-terminal domain-containing protein [Holosporales bacterium]|jgi:peptidyl-prolyl cis-trans isomerase D|nr:SurA N-terminal domain-containing protein [Holosporales bacterium]